jgi:hypothetical protein
MILPYDANPGGMEFSERTVVMSTTAGPNVPFRKGSLYLMPAIDTDASPTLLPGGPPVWECSAIVI